MSVSRSRHVAKTITWRILATSTTIAIAWMITGDWRVGAQVGGIEFFAKMFLYYGHERLWYRFSRLGLKPDAISGSASAD